MQPAPFDDRKKFLDMEERIERMDDSLSDMRKDISDIKSAIIGNSSLKMDGLADRVGRLEDRTTSLEKNQSEIRIEIINAINERKLEFSAIKIKIAVISAVINIMGMVLMVIIQKYITK